MLHYAVPLPYARRPRALFSAWNDGHASAGRDSPRSPTYEEPGGCLEVYEQFSLLPPKTT